MPSLDSTALTTHLLLKKLSLLSSVHNPTDGILASCENRRHRLARPTEVKGFQTSLVGKQHGLDFARWKPPSGLLGFPTLLDLVQEQAHLFQKKNLCFWNHTFSYLHVLSSNIFVVSEDLVRTYVS